MDYFSIGLNIFCLTAQSIMHICFCVSLTGKKLRICHFAIYISLFCILDWLANKFTFPWGIAIGIGVLILYGVNRLILGNRPSSSWTAAILACYISQFSFGIINSVESVIFPHVTNRLLLYLIIIAATAASLVISIVCYTIVVRSISPEEIDHMTNAGCLLVPVLFFFTAEMYIMQTSYTQIPCVTSSPDLLLENAGKHTALLFLQALGLGALLCTLYAYRHLCRSLETKAEMQSLSQAVQAQKIYIAEAQMRYEQTKAFRHDIKNHLSVLSGLLNNSRLEESRAYLQKLGNASTILSFPYQTGNPVVDILLGEKLEMAKEDGIAAEVSLLLPSPCGVDDYDLCVIFANALDNAICACRSIEGERSIHIRGERQGDFYMLAFENTCSDHPIPPAGTGLSNIKAVTEKYHGAMQTEKIDQQFSLSVLLNISIHPKNISIQKP